MFNQNHFIFKLFIYFPFLLLIDMWILKEELKVKKLKHIHASEIN